MRAVAVALDLLSLVKPGVTGMVVATTAAGLWMGAGTAPAPGLALATLVATALVVGAANTLNCWMERDSDRLMRRTARRPLPAGRLQAHTALGFGLALGTVATALFVVFTDVATTAFALVALVSYVLVYTPLKRRSPVALLVGAVPGALPPLIGASAARGALDAAGWCLFALLFAWQVPHFLAIAVRRREEYAAAGLRTVAVVHGEAAARRAARGWAALLLVASLVPALCGLAGAVYAAGAALLGLGFLALTWSPAPSGPWSRRVFLASLAHLLALSVLLPLG